MQAEPLTFKVIALYTSEAHGSMSKPVETLHLRPAYGVVGDSHMEERNLDAEGKIIPNRHFTAVHPGELGKIAHALGVPFIDPAWIKANICFTCAETEQFTTTLVPGTRLLNAQGHAVMEIRGVTDPCLTAGEYIAAHLPHLTVEAQRFPRAAYMLRGVHGITLEETTIRLYETFRALLP